MLDVKGSINNLTDTIEKHFQSIKSQQPFERIWAVQFELAYTDFRVIQMALQMSGDNYHDLLVQFTTNYHTVFNYELAYASGGLAGFNQQFGKQIDQYQTAKDQLKLTIKKISSI